MKQLSFILLILVLLITGCTSTPTGNSTAIVPVLPEGIFTLDTDSSILAWEATRLAAKPHNGIVSISQGTLNIYDGTVRGRFIMDMTSLTETKNNERFLKHIKGEDFFEVLKYPTALFVITELEKTDKGYEITGDLTIKDITNSISFPATLTTKDSLHIKAEFGIDRTAWNIIYDSGSVFLDLGDKAIKDEILVGLDLVFS